MATNLDHHDRVHGLQQLFSGGLSVSVGWPGPESAATQRWSSTIGCPTWQPRPRYLSCVTDVYIYDVLWSSGLF